MLRGIFKPDGTSGERFFRWRGGDVSRLEGLADAVFALTLTLLVVRLEVPTTYAEVRYSLICAPVYLVCFAVFLWIWYCHYQFHRRYGLDGPLTVAIDGAILFVVLLFALPLRFIAQLVYTLVIHGKPYMLDVEGHVMLDTAGHARFSVGTMADNQSLFLFYAAGFAAVFALFALQTADALRRRKALELDALEILVTRGTLGAHALSASVGLLAFALTCIGGPASDFGGASFFLLGPIHGLWGWRNGRRLERLESSLRSDP